MSMRLQFLVGIMLFLRLSEGLWRSVPSRCRSVCLPRGALSQHPHSQSRKHKSLSSFLTFRGRHQMRLACSKVDSRNDASKTLSKSSSVLPWEKGSHNSVKLVVPEATAGSDPRDPYENFREHLNATITACRELGKSSLWVEVPMSRASLIEDMSEFGLRFHHAEGKTAVLNVWLPDSTSKVPIFATHHVGVGAVVINQREEILVVRELRRNYLPWKTPTGLAELGEHLEAAAEREVLEETGIRVKFHSVLGFRQTHGVAHGRSDLFFVCRLDPVEEVDEAGNTIIQQPVIQKCEIETAAWIPLDEYRAMVNGGDGQPGHPMMKHMMAAFDAGRTIEQRVVDSVVPGRPPNSIFFPT